MSKLEFKLEDIVKAKRSLITREGEVMLRKGDFYKVTKIASRIYKGDDVYTLTFEPLKGGKPINTDPRHMLELFELAEDCILKQIWGQDLK